MFSIQYKQNNQFLCANPLAIKQEIFYQRTRREEFKGFVASSLAVRHSRAEHSGTAF